MLLEQLPPPPRGKTGWPWTEESNRCMHQLADVDKVYPKISIVTPSFNQGEFIEETIRSVLLQNYSNLEYIIIDGDSTDESVEIIKKYERWLTYWVSEKDNGQSGAINKGVNMATGELVGWLNSDDLFVKNGLNTIALSYVEHKDYIGWAGLCNLIDRDGNKLGVNIPIINNEIPLSFGDWNNSAYIAQPACLFRLNAFKKVNGVKEYLNFAMDVDLWLQLSKIGNFKFINYPIAVARIYPEAKSNRADPVEYLEILLINYQENNLKITKKMMVNFVRRYMLQAMTKKEFLLVVCTWVYRKSIKNTITYIAQKFYKFNC